MAVFTYVARDGTGRQIKGTLEADNQELLVRRLRERGLFVHQISRQSAAAGVGQMRRLLKVKLRDLAIFCRQFATLIGAGVSLVRALTVMEKQTGNYNLRRVIRDMQAEVEGGASLSRAMNKHPRVFSNLAIGLVRAGEVGGVMEEVWERIAIFLEKDVELRRRVRGAMIYPIVVLMVATLAVILVVTVLLPRFKKIFDDFGVKELPGPTQVLVSVSDFLLGRTWIIPNIVITAAAIILGYGLFRSAIRTKIGSRLWDRFKLKVPIFGGLSQKIAIARFARTLGTLLESGVPILQAMETVAGSVGNVIYADAVLRARASIREGDEIAPPLEASGLFPPMVVHMIGVGEETGALSSMLDKVADFYEKDIDATVQGLASTLEPLMILFLGAAVGFVIVSMYLPIIAILVNAIDKAE